MFKAFILSALFCSSAYSAVNVGDVNVIRAFDGLAAGCKNQDDFYRTMRTGAYTLSNVEAEISDSSQLKLGMEITTFHCVKEMSSYKFVVRKPTDSLVYEWMRFDRDGQSEFVTIEVEKKDVEMISVSDDYLYLDASPIASSQNGFRSELSFDLQKAMSPSQIEKLDNGELVKLRIGLMKRARVRYISPDDISSFRQIAGGVFYIFINLRKDQDKMTLEVI